MRIRNLLGLLCLSSLLFAPLQAREKAPMLGAVHFEIPAWFKASFLEIDAEVAEAAADNKRLMLFFHQDSCPYCAKLVQSNFADPELRDYFQAHFNAVEINLWGDREVTGLSGLGLPEGLKEKDFAAKLNVWATPTLLFFDEKGQVALRINGYYPTKRFLAALRYVAEKKEQDMRFSAYYASLQQEQNVGPLTEQAFFAAGPHRLNLDPGQRPLLVWFEGNACADCARLHSEIFSQPGVRAQLQRYHAVQLHRWADTKLVTPDGRRSTAKDWADELGIDYLPSAVLFVDGKEVLRLAAFFKAFHVESLLDYVASGAFRDEPNVQRYLHNRAESLRERGISVDLWQ